MFAPEQAEGLARNRIDLGFVHPLVPERWAYLEAPQVVPGPWRVRGQRWLLGERLGFATGVSRGFERRCQRFRDLGISIQGSDT
jgi:hypothetical protein